MAWKESLPNGKYRACWRDDLQRKHSATKDAAGRQFARKEDALRYANEQEGKARRGEIRDATGRSPKWSEWREEWLGARAVVPKRDRQQIDKYLTPYWGDYRLNRITREDVQRWVNKLITEPRPPRPRAKSATVDENATQLPPLAPASVERIYQIFSGSMREAMIRRKISATPCVAIERELIAPGHERFLTRKEFDAIADAINEPYRTAIKILVWTGMRFGEMAGLHWQRVDIAAGQISIVETWDTANGRVKPYPKGQGRRNRSLYRTVPIPADLEPVLAAQRELTGAATSCGHPHASGARCRSGLVVTGPKGGPLNARNLGQRDWAHACEFSEVGPTRLHDLRHTYASWLRQAGVPLETIQKLLGHADLSTTQRYSHFGPDEYDVVLAALNRKPSI